MFKNMILLVVLLLPSFAIAKIPVALNLPVTYFSDLKGDGNKEKVLLSLDPENSISLIIYDQDTIAYQLPFDPDGTLSAFKVEPLRKGSKSQIFLNIWRNDAAGAYVRVIEWQDGKYQETFFPKGTRGVGLEDLENNGEQELISYWDKYGDEPPTVYDFDPIQKRYTESNSKHLAFFRKMVDEYEKNLARSTEKGKDCCNRTANLSKLISTDLILDDTKKAKDDSAKLSDIYVEYGKAYYHEKNYRAAIDSYTQAIKYNDHNEKAFGLRGYSYLRNHQVKEAVDSLEHSVALNPNYIDGHYNLALAYWAESQEKVQEYSFRNEAAVKEMQKAVDIDPNVKKRMEEDPQFKPIIKFIGKSKWDKTGFAVDSDEKWFSDLEFVWRGFSSSGMNGEEIQILKHQLHFEDALMSQIDDLNSNIGELRHLGDESAQLETNGTIAADPSSGDDIQAQYIQKDKDCISEAHDLRIALGDKERVFREWLVEEEFIGFKTCGSWMGMGRMTMEGKTPDGLAQELVDSFQKLNKVALSTEQIDHFKKRVVLSFWKCNPAKNGTSQDREDVSEAYQKALEDAMNN